MMIEDFITVKNKRHGSVENFDTVVYVGRPSIFGNPWSHMPNTTAIHKVATRKDAIDAYRQWLTETLSNPATNTPYWFNIENVMVHKIVKHGHLTLLCWCAPLPCHANIIASVVWRRLNELYEYDKRYSIWLPKVSSNNPSGVKVD